MTPIRHFFRFGIFGLALFQAACGACIGEIVTVEGIYPLMPGESAQLEFHFDGDTVVSGPGDCDGFWYVNDVEGGNDTVGKIDPCGLYRAPAAAPSHSVSIMAASYAVGTCADCCPYAILELELAPD